MKRPPSRFSDALRVADPRDLTNRDRSKAGPRLKFPYALRAAFAAAVGCVSVFWCVKAPAAAENRTRAAVALTASPADGGTVEGAGHYLLDTPVSIKAVPAAGYVFDRWTGAQGESLRQAEIHFTTATDRTLTAHFKRPQIVISPAVRPQDGGEIAGAGRYDAGQKVTLLATPRKGFVFAGWENGQDLRKTPVLVFDAAPGTAWVARFAPEKISHRLTVRTEPAQGGSVQGGGVYPGGARVHVLAKPAEGWTFLYWQGPAVEAAKLPQTTVFVGGDTEVTAVFAEKRVQLAIAVSPKEAGTVTGAGVYADGTRVNLAATPNAGWRFVRWEGPVGEPDKARTLITCAGNVALTALFETAR